jgi:hypothetical protein
MANKKENAFKDNAREFPDGGGKVDADPCPDNLLGGRVIAWQRKTLCATVRRRAKLLICGNYLVVAISNIGSRMLMKAARQTATNFVVRRTSQAGVSSTFKPNYSRLILARWQGFQAILPASFVS